MPRFFKRPKQFHCRMLKAMSFKDKKMQMNVKHVTKSQTFNLVPRKGFGGFSQATSTRASPFWTEYCVSPDMGNAPTGTVTLPSPPPQPEGAACSGCCGIGATLAPLEWTGAEGVAYSSLGALRGWSRSWIQMWVCTETDDGEGALHTASKKVPGGWRRDVSLPSGSLCFV